MIFFTPKPAPTPSAQGKMDALESRARFLRDQVFGAPSTDNNWSHCGANWMRADSLQWLEEQAAKMSRGLTQITNGSELAK